MCCAALCILLVLPKCALGCVGCLFIIDIILLCVGHVGKKEIMQVDEEMQKVQKTGTLVSPPALC